LRRACYVEKKIASEKFFKTGESKTRNDDCGGRKTRMGRNNGV